MGVLSHLSDIVIPAVIFYIVAYGLSARVKVYESFLKGAKDGLKTVAEIVPTLVGLMVAVGVLRASGFLSFLGKLIAPLAEPAKIPAPVIPLILVKLFSSSAAVGLLLDIFKESGPDSFIGLAASIMMSCTETVFYTMSVYFLAAKVTKTRYTLAGALLSSLVGCAASIALAGLMA